jgi:hypothetical protein
MITNQLTLAYYSYIGLINSVQGRGLYLEYIQQSKQVKSGLKLILKSEIIRLCFMTLYQLFINEQCKD